MQDETIIGIDDKGRVVNKTESKRHGPREHFLGWFDRTAAEDGIMIWTKAKEYGGIGLTAEALGILTQQDQASLNLETALAVNAVQKLNRIVEALRRGELPAVDSWRDLVCYGMIARRIRETRSWPA